MSPFDALYPLPDSPHVVTSTTQAFRSARTSHPSTGADINTWLLAALVCLVAGLLLVAICYVGRRR